MATRVVREGPAKTPATASPSNAAKSCAEGLTARLRRRTEPKSHGSQATYGFGELGLQRLSKVGEVAPITATSLSQRRSTAVQRGKHGVSFAGQSETLVQRMVLFAGEREHTFRHTIFCRVSDVACGLLSGISKHQRHLLTCCRVTKALCRPACVRERWRLATRELVGGGSQELPE